MEDIDWVTEVTFSALAEVEFSHIKIIRTKTGKGLVLQRKPKMQTQRMFTV